MTRRRGQQARDVTRRSYLLPSQFGRFSSRPRIVILTLTWDAERPRPLRLFHDCGVL